jgi:malonyl-CoA/methylmalonyl-CoA synthetase
MTNLYTHIQASLQTRAADIVIDAGTRTVSGNELDRWVARYANTLLSLGICPGDRVAVQVDKSLENIVLYLACLRVGAIYLPLNSAYRAAEVAYFLKDATPRLFIAAPERQCELHPTATDAGVAATLTLGVRGDGIFVDLAASQAESAPIVDRDADDLAVICYTSGTTGRSKGAMITHDNLLSNARSLVQLWEFTSKDVLLHALPLYHIHGLFVALHCSLLSCAKILLQSKFDASVVLDSFAKATVMMGVPTFYTRLLAETRLTRDAVKNVRLFISGSAPLLSETFNSFEQRTGHRILERYGMTETGMIASNPLAGERRAGTVGLPLPGVQVRIADPQDGVGIVEVKGPNVFKGYWNMPDKTKSEFRDDGFFITGDMGLVDDAGYLNLVGRAKDLIISGGLNVYPKEIEDAIDALDGVIESAVFAIPHPDFGEAVAAAVTLQRNSTLTADTIVGALRVQLAAFKTPKRVYVLDELPRNAMSKVQKALLREQYKSEFSKR